MMKTIQELINDKNTVIIEQRTAGEYGVSHYPGAINIPLDELPKHLNQLKAENKPILLYCRSGNRSGIGMNFLLQQGFQEVYNGGGLNDMLFYQNK